MLHERQRRALLAALSHLMRLKYLLHDSISKQVHVNLTEVNMHGTRIARIVVRHVSEAMHPMDRRAQEYYRAPAIGSILQ
jgi:hypothetical protein